MKALAYGKQLVARRVAGERVGLLVVSIHDWESGKWFESRPEVARVVLSADAPVDGTDWSVALALDCVVTGPADDALFYEVCAALSRAGAASVWGDFDDGLWLLEQGKRLWHAVDGPYPLGKLGGVLRRHREVYMMLRRGFYGSRVFDAARRAVLASFTKVAA